MCNLFKQRLFFSARFTYIDMPRAPLPTALCNLSLLSTGVIDYFFKLDDEPQFGFWSVLVRPVDEAGVESVSPLGVFAWTMLVLTGPQY